MLLTTARKKDLEVLYIIITSYNTSYSLIQKKTEIVPRTAKEIVKRLNETINDYFSFIDFIESNNKGEIFINQNYISEKFSVFFGLRLLWYKDSSLLNILNIVASEGKINRKVAADTLYLSESGLNKIQKKINQYLILFSLQLVSNKGELILEGDELRIRIFLFKYLYYTYLNIEWPFSNIDLKTLENSINPSVLDNNIFTSQTRKRAYFLILVILKNRYESQRYVENINKDNAEILNIFNKNTSYFLLENLFSNEVPNAYINIEKAIAEICLRMYVPEVDSDEDQIYFGRIFSSFENKKTKLALDLIGSLDLEFSLNPENKSSYIRIYQLVLFLVIYDLLGDALVPFIYMHFPKPTYHLYTDNKMMKTIKKIVTKSGIHPQEFINIISSFLYSLYITHFQKKVCIYLEFSKDISAPYYVKNRIQSIYNHDNIIFISDWRKADLIITDTFDIQKDPQKFFYLMSTNDEKGWKDLIFDIQNLISHKIFEK